MPSRTERLVTYVTPEEKADLAEMADNAGKSQSDLLRDALTEYLDHDRSDRIEEKVDQILATIDSSQSESTHTRTQTGASETVEKARRIAERIYENHGETVKGVDVKRAIEDVAGGDERTISKYKGILRERDLLFEHPSSDATVWTPSREVWVDWSESYLDGVPEAEIFEVVEPYSMGVEEYDEIAEAIQ